MSEINENKNNGDKFAVKMPNVSKILQLVDENISSKSYKGEYKDFYMVDLFGTGTNILYVFHTGVLIKKLIDNTDPNWAENIRENKLITEIYQKNSFLSNRLGLGYIMLPSLQNMNSLDRENISNIDKLFDKEQMVVGNLQGITELINNKIYSCFVSNNNSSNEIEKIWSRIHINSFFENKYIAVITDFTQESYADIQDFVVADFKNQPENEGDKYGLLDELKKYLKGYLSNPKNIPTFEVLESIRLEKIRAEEFLKNNNLDNLEDIDDIDIESDEQKYKKLKIENPSKQYKEISFLLKLKKGTSAIILSGVGATAGGVYVGMNPYLIGGIGIVGVVIIPYLFYKFLKNKIIKDLEKKQDYLSEDEYYKIYYTA